jgi:hypothetical protein
VRRDVAVLDAFWIGPEPKQFKKELKAAMPVTRQ